MKKHVIRILIVFILSILILCNFCYADLLPIEPTNGTRVNRPKPINTNTSTENFKTIVLKNSFVIAGIIFLVVAGEIAVAVKSINDKNKETKANENKEEKVEKEDEE